MVLLVVAAPPGLQPEGCGPRGCGGRAGFRGWAMAGAGGAVDAAAGRSCRAPAVSTLDPAAARAGGRVQRARGERTRLTRDVVEGDAGIPPVPGRSGLQR